MFWGSLCILAFTGIVWAESIPRATTDQCITLRAANIACTPGITLIDKATETLLQASLGSDSPIAFLQKHATKGANVACLDPEFAKTVKTFFEATYQATGHMPVVSDGGGYRGPGAQNRAAASGASGVRACGSPHNYGLAIDVNNESKATIAWMRAHVGNTRSSQPANFGLRTIGNPADGCGLRAANGRSFCDPAHFELATWRQVRGQCGRCGDVAGDGALASPPSPEGFMSRITEPFRNLFQQEAATSPSTPSALPSVNTAPQEAFEPVEANVNNNTNTVGDSSPAKFSFPTSTSTAQSSEDLLRQIAVGPTQIHNTTTPSYPLTVEERARLQELQVKFYPNTSVVNTLDTPSSIQPIPSPPFAGFIPTEELAAQEPSWEFLRLYVQILDRVTRAVQEILRIMNGVPPANPNAEEGPYQEP